MRVSEKVVPCLLGPQAVCATCSHLLSPSTSPTPPSATTLPGTPTATSSGQALSVCPETAQPSDPAPHSPPTQPTGLPIGPPQGSVPSNLICSVSHCGELICAGPRA